MLDCNSSEKSELELVHFATYHELHPSSDFDPYDLKVRETHSKWSAANNLVAPKSSHSSSASLVGAFLTMYARFQTQTAFLTPPVETEKACCIASNWVNAQRIY